MKSQKSYYAKPSDYNPKWFIIDANNQILGRLASQVASIVRGKEKPTFTPSMDTGDFVIVINCDKIKVTGKKLKNKRYYRHSQYPGGLKSIQLDTLLKKDSTKAVHTAIKGMLPHNRMGSQIIKKVKLYTGDQHPHEAQSPQIYELQS